MADIIKPDQKFRTHGYFDAAAVAEAYPTEWAAYTGGANYRARSTAKGVLKGVIKGLLGLPETAVIDFQRVPDGRYRVDEVLTPPKTRKRANDLSALFRKP